MRTILTALFFLVAAAHANATKRKVLFIGNSYTAYNNLPQLIADISTSKGDTLEFTSHNPGGATANMHWNNSQVHTYIQQGGWDYVVLQFQSQEPSFSPGQVQSQTYPYVKSLDSLVNVTNPCAEVLYFMTWGRKNGDASNCANYPPICTYEGMQQRLRESYMMFAQDFNSSVCPVGSVWKQCRDLYPTINLYNADESHPSMEGSYLAACTFYSSIFRKSSVGSTFLPSGMNNTQTNNIQTLASNTVLDSAKAWLEYGKQSLGIFSYTTNGLNVTFNNTSLKMLACSWNFGDGSSSIQVNPTRTFASAGTYNVCLTIPNGCAAFSHTLCKSITVSAGVGLDEKEKSQSDIKVIYNKIFVTKDYVGSKYVIVNSLGQKVQEGKVNEEIDLKLDSMNQALIITILSPKGNLSETFIW